MPNQPDDREHEGRSALNGSAVFAGADIGSTTTKVVLLSPALELLCWDSVRTGARPKDALSHCMEKALAGAGKTSGDVVSCIMTGYGRYIIESAQAVSEITCHARGIYAVFPRPGSVLEVGGQDSKAFAVNERGDVANFVMNDKCAAGTGRFVEVMARIMDVPLQDIGPLSLKASEPLPISSTCTVFAESEVISHIANGHGPAEITAGVHMAIARRLAPLVRKVGVRDPLIMTGGCAYNAGLMKALEHVLGVKLVTPPEPLITGALGAALIAIERYTGKRVSADDLRAARLATEPTVSR